MMSMLDIISTKFLGKPIIQYHHCWSGDTIQNGEWDYVKTHIIC